MLLKRARNIGWLIGLVAIVAAGFFVYGALSGAQADSEPNVFEVKPGESLSQIATNLSEVGFIPSPFLFKVMAVLEGKSNKLQAGRYMLDAAMSMRQILKALSAGPRTARITVVEGVSVYEIDQLLSDATILKPGELVGYARARQLEGRLFPDTYDFYVNSKVEEVVDKFLVNFQKKAAPLLPDDSARQHEILVLASILEREVPDAENQRKVGGILLKRLKEGMPLQVDASICYIKKQQSSRPGGGGCYPLSPLDFKIDSSYNTYLNRGWPPGPIGSPGASAISAALQPQSSPYWFYLSDPATGKTIFSRTFEEHNRNRALYLK